MDQTPDFELEQRKRRQSDSFWSGCMFSFLGFVFGFVGGAALTIFFWQRFYPPSGPDYGDGFGYGIAMLFYAVLIGLFCGVIGSVIGLIRGTKRQ